MSPDWNGLPICFELPVATIMTALFHVTEVVSSDDQVPLMVPVLPALVPASAMNALMEVKSPQDCWILA